MSARSAEWLRLVSLLILPWSIGQHARGDDATQSQVPAANALEEDTAAASRVLDLALSGDDLDAAREAAADLSQAERDQICLLESLFELSVDDKQQRNERLVSIGWTGPFYEAAPVQGPVPLAREQPRFTEEARRRKVQGQIELRGILDQDGSLRDLIAVEGHPLLVEAALGKVPQWTFQPAELEGRPVAVCYSVRIRFSLR